MERDAWLATYPFVAALLQRDDDELLYAPRTVTGGEEPPGRPWRAPGEGPADEPPDAA